MTFAVAVFSNCFVSFDELQSALKICASKKEIQEMYHVVQVVKASIQSFYENSELIHSSRVKLIAHLALLLLLICLV